MVKIFDQVAAVPWLAISAPIVIDVLQNVLSLYVHKYMRNFAIIKRCIIWHSL